MREGVELTRLCSDLTALSGCPVSLLLWAPAIVVGTSDLHDCDSSSTYLIRVTAHRMDAGV